MPIYEYQCQQCAHRFDKLQKLSDAPLHTCPECQQESLSKLVSAPRFKLTGTGWYETDFKNKKPKENAQTDNSTNTTKTADTKKKNESDSKKNTEKSDSSDKKPAAKD